MDGLKTLTQGILVVGMVFVWPGPELYRTLQQGEQTVLEPPPVRTVTPTPVKTTPAKGREWFDVCPVLH